MATIDPRGISHTSTYNSRGQLVEQIQAAGTAVAGKTQSVYDSQGNVLEVRAPRWFDSADANGLNKASEAYSYTRRNLRKTHTLAVGDADYPQGARAMESWTYYLDRNVNTHTDFRGNAWQTLWSSCCASRMTGQIDPMGTGRTQDYDRYGNVTHAQTIHGTEIFAQTTTRYDARHRKVAQTVWLVTQANVDPKNPPIAGGGRAGDPAAHDAEGKTVGLTTRWFYDDDLTDGQGLDNATGLQVARLKGTGNYNVSIVPLLTQTYADLGGGQSIFGAGSPGTAVVVVNAEDEITASVNDSAGRQVASGLLKPDATLVTWSSVKYDTVAAVTAPGNLVETARIDALDHISRSRSDAAGRMIESYDALNKLTSSKYDANGNLLSVRDPNNVGWDAGTALGTFNGYDERNRLTVRIDTQGDKTSSGYDANGNVVRSTDAKNQSATALFDARGQRRSQTDRLGGVTTFKYDAGGNLLEMCDADNQGPPQKPTIWTYDLRNQKLTEAYPGHDPASQVGDAGYDKKLFGYDLAGRASVFTDQQGDTVTFGYDLAGRMLKRDYRQAGQQAIADSDSFTFDDASRLLAAVSGRYNNTVAFQYGDGAGRRTSEALTVNLGQARTYTVGSQYDVVGRLARIVYPDGGLVDRSYTERNQLFEVKYQNALVARFTYDNGGRRVTRVLGDTPGTTTTSTYGRTGWPVASCGFATTTAKLSWPPAIERYPSGS